MQSGKLSYWTSKWLPDPIFFRESEAVHTYTLVAPLVQGAIQSPLMPWAMKGMETLSEEGGRSLGPRAVGSRGLRGFRGSDRVGDGGGQTAALCHVPGKQAEKDSTTSSGKSAMGPG